MQSGLKVKLNPSILEDGKRRLNFHICKRIIDENLEGEIVGKDKKKYHSGLWVRFKYGKVLVEQKQVVPVEKS